MSKRTGRPGLATIVLLGMAALAGVSPAGAIDLQPINPRINGLRNNPAYDLPALQSQQRRLDFQAQQQRLREDDRNAVTRQRLDLTVPTLKKRCRTEVFGNHYVTSCD